MILVLYYCVGVTHCQNRQVHSVQRFEREPEDQTAVVGETVVMACRVLNKGGVLQWTKDDFGLGSDRNLSGFERYSMIGTEDEGIDLFPLFIKRMILTVYVSWACHYYFLSSVPSILSITAPCLFSSCCSSSSATNW